MEKIIHKRLYSYLIRNNIPYNRQYAITELINHIIAGLEDQMYTLAVFLDFSKAFGTIDHDIIFTKLNF